MPAGALDQRVTIRRASRVSDGGGGYTETWADIVTVWADVAPMSGREVVQAAALEAPAIYRVTIRRREDIDERDRLVWRGREMNIRYIAWSGRDPYLRIDAEMGVP